MTEELRFLLDRGSHGIRIHSQKGLDKITRLRPEILTEIAKGELSIEGALRLFVLKVLKVREIPPVESPKKAISKLSDHERVHFRH